MPSDTVTLEPGVETHFGLDQAKAVFTSVFGHSVDSCSWHLVDGITMQYCSFGNCVEFMPGPWIHNDRMGMMPDRVPNEMRIWATAGLEPEDQFEYDEDTDTPRREVQPTGFTATLTHPREGIALLTVRLVMPEGWDQEWEDGAMRREVDRRYALPGG